MRVPDDDAMHGPTVLAELVRGGVLDAEIGALVWLLADRGVPLVVASPDRAAAEALRTAVREAVLANHPARDAVAGGVVIGASLEDVLRVLGATAPGQPGTAVPDETRDLGVVLVLDGGRLRAAHYVRPVERDAQGHLQRRPPAVLGARDEQSGRLDHFYWAVTDELAARAGMERYELEQEHRARARLLTTGDSVVGPGNARH